MLEDLLVWIIKSIISLFKKDDKKPKTIYQYYQKNIMTEYETYFYNIFKQLEDELNIIVQPQIPLSAIVQRKNNSRIPNELFRIIDFGIFSRDYNELILLIEINDKTHNTSRRRRRDQKIKFICRNAGIRLIAFYSNKPNEYNYVKNRLREEIMAYLNNKNKDNETV